MAVDPCTYPPGRLRRRGGAQDVHRPGPVHPVRGPPGGTSFPQLLNTGPEVGLRWLPLCAGCTDAYLAHLSAITDRVHGIRR